MNHWELGLALCIGVGLAAACGFRIFVPLLVMAVAARAEWLSLGEGFAWIGSTPAIAAFAIATLVEILGYCIPWVDNALDTIATPTAVVAGTVATSAMIAGEMHPLLQWSVAAILGGGAAGVTQVGTVVVRAASTAFTGGLGNWLVSIAEAILSIVVALLAIVMPVVALMALALAAVVFIHWLNRKNRRTESAVAAIA